MNIDDELQLSYVRGYNSAQQWMPKQHWINLTVAFIVAFIAGFIICWLIV